MKLHQYQKNCLEDLKQFLKQTEKLESPQKAFSMMQNRRYSPPPEISETIPYVCIRAPTGGGKTLMAAHAVGAVAKEYLHNESPVCLWLAPSNAIVTQTLKALQNRDHPCYLALAENFNVVNCISAAAALRLNKHDLDGAATIIVTTTQSLRVEKTEGRKIYNDNGNLMPHFESISDELRDGLECAEDGGIQYSLANALRLRCPIIISDEAHNAGTSLSYESLSRFNPSCIVEFTATPQTEHKPQQNKYASNVISQVSARELKEAGMIKFPLNLIMCEGWRENIRAAIAKQKELEKQAKKTDEYIRPIVLYQAENKGGEATVEVIKNALIDGIDGFDIPAEHIAVHTGTTRELTKQANINLFSDKCDIRHIITVKALAEGWDCSFAYILCAMANLQSGRPVEQILGRILRMPQAKRKKINALNECYAYTAKGNFYNVAHALTDALIKKSGFQKMEAADFVSVPDDTPPPLFGGQPITTQKTKYKPLKIPLLMARENNQLVFIEQEHFLGAKWSIAKENPKMSNFTPPQVFTGRVTIDVDKLGRLKTQDKTVDAIRHQLMLLEADKKWSQPSLAAWLDAEISHPDIPQMQSLPYIVAAVNQLIKKHSLTKLARWRFSIKEKIADDINKLRKTQRAKGYQQMLKNMAVDNGKLEVSAANVLTFERGRYAAHWLCENVGNFDKHIFSEVGELKDSGEEWECAKFINNLPQVETWLRNLARRDNSFWLQTSSDKFYPDFVCRLTDGRILVVEYKGENMWSNDDSKEKRQIGEIWAKLSNGKCLFIMPKGRDLQQIKDCIAR